jgi:hypothetical protein
MDRRGNLARYSFSDGGALGDVIYCKLRASGYRVFAIHRSFGQGSVSQAAVEHCREHGIAVIPGGCPMMFAEPVDWGHKCMRWLLGVTGGLPAPEGQVSP